ncbi:MAG TPA: hypothetical protein VNY07_04870 [Chthoniobacterales bacterium]|nr:hypothetical protein [Chthoniobacterales bacterium]
MNPAKSARAKGRVIAIVFAAAIPMIMTSSEEKAFHAAEVDFAYN